jgi:hypothetical protein
MTHFDFDVHDGFAPLVQRSKTFGGVLLSEDGGTQWEKIEDLQFGSPIRSLAQDPLDPSIIYLGTGSEGIYRLSLTR